MRIFFAFWPPHPSRKRLPPRPGRWRPALHCALCALLGCLLTLSLCVAPALAQEDPGPVISFADPLLEKKVRETLEKMEGDITLADIQSVHELHIPGPGGGAPPEDYITDISPLADFTHLQVLVAHGNAISDISPLRALKELKAVILGGNQVSDVSPLSACQGLEALELRDNQVRDLSPLAGLKNLKMLLLEGNPVDDWSVLGNLYPALEEKDFDPAQEGLGRVISFPEYRLEKKVREALGKWEGDITLADVQSIRELDISNPILDVPAEDRIKDLSPLKDFIHLGALRAYNNEISDLSPLFGLEELSFLDLGGNQVSDLGPLASLQNLKAVGLWFNNGITDLSPLAASKDLRSLDAQGNRIVDIGPLKDLTQLESLRLHNNQIRDVSPLAGLNRLTLLELGGNPVDDWSVLADLYPNLKESDFDPAMPGMNQAIAFDDKVLEEKIRAGLGKPKGDITLGDALALREANLGFDYDNPKEKKIRSLEALRNFPNLFKIDAWNNEIMDLGPLAGLENLGMLVIDGNPVQSLEALAQTPNLEYLNASNCQIQDVAPLQGLARLSWLNLAHNQIGDVSPLSSLTGLRSLWLAGNPVSDFSPLQRIEPGLTEKDFRVLVADGVPDEPIDLPQPAFEGALRRALDIFDRPITQRDAFMVTSLGLYNEKTPESEFTDLSPLQWFVNLERLDFNGNPYTDLSPLGGLTQLKSLRVAFSQVADLGPLAGLIQLENLDVSYSQAADLAPLAGLTGLRTLNLEECPVMDLTPLAGLTQLTELNLKGCEAVTDVSPLAGLASLKKLVLTFTAVEDISVLKALPELVIEKEQ